MEGQRVPTCAWACGLDGHVQVLMTAAITALSLSPLSFSLSCVHARACVQGHSAEVICISFSTVGDKVLTGSFDNTVTVWDTAEGK